MINGWARRALALGVVATLPLAARAQSSTSITGSAAPTVSNNASVAYEQVFVRDPSKVIVLRFRGVFQGSDNLTLDNQPLTRGDDYRIDYISGTLSLVRQVNAGQLLRATYKYDVNSQPVQRGIAAKASSVRDRPFGMDMGGAPRLPVGKSGLFGWNSTASIGGVGSKGLLLFEAASKPSGRIQVVDDAPNQLGKTDSEFVVQSLSTNIGKGTIKFDFQHISASFGAFDQVQAAGFDEATVKQLQHEAGMKRMGFSMQDVHLGRATVSNNFHSVADDGGRIDWRSLAINTGALSLSYDARHVDLGFTRFNDLAEKDRDQLMKEAGIGRQTISGAYATKSGTLKFASNQIRDEYGHSIADTLVNLSAGKWKLNMGEQIVGSDFARFDSLPDAEKSQWSSFAGLHKKWMAFETSPFGKGVQPVKLAMSSVTGNSGSLSATDASAGGKNWSLEISSRKMDSNFGMAAALPDSEADQHVQAIAKMYQATGIGTGAGDRSALIQGPPVDRSSFRFTATPRKDWNLDLEQVMVRGALDFASLQTLAMNSKNIDFSYRKEHQGANFSEAPQLLAFEQQRLGNIPGLDKTDLSLNWRLGGFKKLSISLLEAMNHDSGLKRDSVTYSDKRIEASLNTREVDPGFASVGNLPDSENGLLNALVGFKETDFRLKWQVSPKLSLATLWEDQGNPSQKLASFQHNVFVNWDPNKSTHVSYTLLDTLNESDQDLLFRNRLSALKISKDLGKYGKLQYMHQDSTVIDPNGNPAPPVVAAQQAPTPDSNAPQGTASQDYISYEANLDKNTSVKTEQSRTRYANGTKQDVSANTISRALTSRFGLSYTDLHIDRPGNDKDEKRNNYGFWFDLAKGVRMSYGFVRDINPLAGNTSNSNIGITPGNVGLIHVGGFGYGVNSWDDQHNQVTSNFQLNSSKPVQLGFLRDIQFNLGMDTSSDYSAYTKNNRLFNVSGRIGSNTLMAEYKSQMDQGGLLGIDRFFKFETDQSEKRWIKASIKVKQRETPTDGTTMIRDYAITVKPLKNLELTNQLLTNPEEQFRPDVLMGSTTSPWRVNKYKLDYHSGLSTTIGATWEDRINDLTHDFTRTGGISLQLFQNSGSPLTVWYGLEQGGTYGQRQTAQRYYLKYYQKAGPNQVFNIFAGNISYDYAVANGFSRNNWTLHMDYQYRFW